MLQLVPITTQDAKAYVLQKHRHHKPPVSALVSVGVARGDEVCGVAMIGRPVARGNQDGFTAEVTRCCTDGTQNACSMLYGAAWRAARALGYRRLITYTLPQEGGASLRASGFRVVGEVRGRSWHTPSRPRVDHNPAQDKLRWEIGVAV